MTTVQRCIVIVLATLSALCEIAGTVTVLMTYRRTARLGVAIRNDIASLKALYEAQRSDTGQSEWDQKKVYVNPMEYRDSKIEQLEHLDALAEPLQPNWWTLFGLLAYIFGAVFGLAAAVVASA
ncbi:MAG TPA: hypothetical protein VMV53_10170 [Acidimicrobiales bacterium]|nr:hypothetical protein [Acidimicrobiales bacterium]